MFAVTHEATPPPTLVALRCVSSEQLLILLLLAAAFAAGWVARGSGDEGGETTPDAPDPDDPLVGEADTVLGRAVTAARAARSVLAGPAGASEAATRASLGVLDQRIAELEDMADRLEAARGQGDAAFEAFDRTVSGMATLHRRLGDDAAMAEVEAAAGAWEQAIH